MVRHAATATATPPNAMIIPASIDINGFSRHADAKFNVTGIAGNGTPTNFPLANVFIDPMTNLQIGVHYPLMDYSQSSRNPRALANSGLSETVYIRMMTSGTTPTPEGYYKAVMASAIIGSQGAGELMIAYPQSTAHTVEVAPEVMRMQMRAYLGAAVLQQENVIRVPYVFCEHIVQFSDASGTELVPSGIAVKDLFDGNAHPDAEPSLSISIESRAGKLLKEMVDASGPVTLGQYDSDPTDESSQKDAGSTQQSNDGKPSEEVDLTEASSLKESPSAKVDLTESLTESSSAKGSSTKYTTEGSSALFTEEETSVKKKKKGRT